MKKFFDALFVFVWVKTFRKVHSQLSCILLGLGQPISHMWRSSSPKLRNFTASEEVYRNHRVISILQDIVLRTQYSETASEPYQWRNSWPELNNHIWLLRSLGLYHIFCTFCIKPFHLRFIKSELQKGIPRIFLQEYHSKNTVSKYVHPKQKKIHPFASVFSNFSATERHVK